MRENTETKDLTKEIRNLGRTKISLYPLTLMLEDFPYGHMVVVSQLGRAWCN